MEKVKQRGIFGEFIQGFKEVARSFVSSEDNMDEKTLNEAPANIKAEFAKAYALIEKEKETKKTKGKTRIEINTDKAINTVKNNRSKKEKGREIGDD